MAKTNKKTEIIILQLSSICYNTNQRMRCSIIEKEYKDVNVVEKTCSGSNKQLYKLLHITRFLDTSLRLFLEIHGCLGNKYSIGEYIKELERSHVNLNRLNSGLRKRFVKDIADVRNKYLHTSGQIPNKNEYGEIYEKIHECLQTVLSLHI